MLSLILIGAILVSGGNISREKISVPYGPPYALEPKKIYGRNPKDLTKKPLNWLFYKLEDIFKKPKIHLVKL